MTVSPDSGISQGAGGGTGTDADAIHVNVAAEIDGITEKVTPSGSEYLVVEDPADSLNKKKVAISNLPTAGGGEANTASNIGTAGVGLFDGKVGIDLQFKNITSTNNRLSVTDDTVNNEVDLAVEESNIVHQNLSGSGTNTHAQIDTHIGSTANPHSVTANQVLPSQTGETGKVLGTDGVNTSWVSGGGAVDSVNTQTGTVVLDADDISDSATTNKFATAAQLSKVDAITDTGSGVVISSAERTKLDGIEALAEVNPTAAQIKTLYESNADTNAFTNAEQTKLSGIEDGATNTVIDTVLSSVSTNPLENKAIDAALDLKANTSLSNVLEATVTSKVSQATESVLGKIAIATEAEVIAGTNTDDAVVSSTLKAVTDTLADVDLGNVSQSDLLNKIPNATESQIGILQLASVADVTAGTNTTKAVTSAGAAAVYAVDSNLFHINVAGEIDALVNKASPITTDVLLIEDSADSNNKKKVQISNLPTGTASPASEVVTTATKTLALTDANTFQRCTSASATVLTVPPNSSVAFALNTEIAIYQEGAGQVSVAAGAGVTVNSFTSYLNVNGQYSSVALRKTATDTWVLVGNLKA